MKHTVQKDLRKPGMSGSHTEVPQATRHIEAHDASSSSRKVYAELHGRNIEEDIAEYLTDQRTPNR